MPEELLNKKVSVDIDSDGKSDFKLDIKSILIVGGFLVTGAMSYQNLKQDIEIAKTLPEYEINQDDTRVINQKMDYIIKELEKYETQTNRRLENLEDKVYKK